MPLPTVTLDQVRAARGLLNMTQAELARRAGVSKFAVINLELNKATPTQETLARVVEAFELAGVEFIEDGIRRKKDSLVILEGEGWFLRLLDDVHTSLRAGEASDLLLEFADERKSSPLVVEKIRAMRRDGLHMRLLVCEGDTYLMGPLEEYRYMPAKHFRNYVSLIYGDKVAVCTDGNVRAVVIKDPMLATTRRAMFEIVWSLLPKPKTSTATERFE